MIKERERLFQISKEISALERERSDLDRECRKLSREKIDEIPPEYFYEIVPAEINLDDEGSFRILRKLTNYEVYQDIIKEYGHPTFTGFEDNESVLSVSYIRKDDGIITHKGGGWLILDDPFFWSEDEWKLLIEGDDSIIKQLLK